MPDLRTVLQDALGRPRKDGRTELAAVVEALLARAQAGDVRAAELLLERAFGRTPQRADVAVDLAARAVPPIAWVTVPSLEPPR